MDKDSKSVTRRFVVSGKVQGVFFRASTRKKALELGLTGYAKNLQSGQVEVMAQGDSNAIEKLFAWLHEGPRMAKVESVVEVDAGKPNLTNVFMTL